MRLVKLIVVVAVIVVIWKFVLPRINHHDVKAGAGQNESCAQTARRASEEWGSGVGRFVNPPYDLDAWSSFRGGVEKRISDAESDCNCAEESCRKVRDAMHDLRALVSDLDTSIRNGSAPPEDIVQRQESIDNRINGD
jgi:hypothetical protein